MKAVQRLSINKDKLYAQLRSAKPQTPITEISKAIGYNPSFLSNCAVRGSMPLPAAIILQNVYGIEPSSYTADEGEEVERVPDAEAMDYEKLAEVIKEAMDIDWLKLNKCIYTAVYAAVKKAWSE